MAQPANVYVNPTLYVKQTLMALNAKLIAANMVHRDYVKEYLTVAGATRNIRRPVYYRAVDGSTSMAGRYAPIKQSTTDITIDKVRTVGVDQTCIDQTLNFDRFKEDFVDPASEALFQAIEEEVLGVGEEFFRMAGTAASTPDSFTDLAEVGLVMDEANVPMSDRKMIVAPNSAWALADDLRKTYVGNDIASKALRKAFLGEIADFEVFKSNCLKYHTVGTGIASSGTANVNDADAHDDDSPYAFELVTHGWGAGETLTKGDLIKIANTNDVNPRTGENLDRLKTFAVTALTTADGAGNMTIPIYPGIVSDTSSAYCTVLNTPANGSVITVIDSHKVNIAFAKNAISLVFADLVDLAGQENTRARGYGMSIRLCRGSNLDENTNQARMDILIGVKSCYPELGCRLLSVR